ncbi:aspartyl protease [Infirmifilum lucidum]|uniref:aspartyl protease n=1 Tax=Infirmifilum lucidum TaxID=2776706 RepID=UPI001CEC7122|nr:aspartyl protease [Infirmifilum lucidum]
MLARQVEVRCYGRSRQHGATLSVISRSLAEELGIKVVRRDQVETGAGMIIVDRGVAVIAIGDRETISEVWVSDIISRVLVGSVTLELLGLRVDPRTGKLEPAPLLLYTTLQQQPVKARVSA